MGVMAPTPKFGIYIDVIFNIKRVEICCVTFVSTQHDPFYKRVKWVGSSHDTIIKWVRFELRYLVEYPYLDTTL